MFSLLSEVRKERMLPIYHHESEHLLTAPWMYTEFREDLIRWPVNKTTCLLCMDCIWVLDFVCMLYWLLHRFCMVVVWIECGLALFGGPYLMEWRRGNASLCLWAAAMEEQAMVSVKKLMALAKMLKQVKKSWPLAYSATVLLSKYLI